MDDYDYKEMMECHEMAFDDLHERIEELEAALKKIRGWREIGSAVTDYERVHAMEQIADAALSGETE